MGLVAKMETAKIFSILNLDVGSWTNEEYQHADNYGSDHAGPVTTILQIFDQSEFTPVMLTSFNRPDDINLHPSSLCLLAD